MQKEEFKKEVIKQYDNNNEFAEKVLSTKEADDLHLWHGKIHNPYSKQHELVRYHDVFAKEKPYRAMYLNEKFGSKIKLEDIDYEYILQPEMAPIFEEFKRIHGRELWDTPEIRKLNTLESLKGVGGFDEGGCFNWLANGYIRITEDEWGYVGKRHVFEILNDINGNLLDNEDIIAMNLIENEAEWYPRYPWGWYPISGNVLNPAALGEDTFHRILYRDFPKKDSFGNFIPYTCMDPYCPELPHYFFKERQIVARPALYGLIKIDTDKYITVGAETSFKWFEKINNEVPYWNAALINIQNDADQYRLNCLKVPVFGGNLFIGIPEEYGKDVQCLVVNEKYAQKRIGEKEPYCTVEDMPLDKPINEIMTFANKRLMTWPYIRYFRKYRDKHGWLSPREKRMGELAK